MKAAEAMKAANVVEVCDKMEALEVLKQCRMQGFETKLVSINGGYLVMFKSGLGE